jgi:hypothetical protein
MLVARASPAVFAPNAIPHVSSRRVSNEIRVASRKSCPSRLLTSKCKPSRNVVTNAQPSSGFGAGVATSITTIANPMDDHVPIDRLYHGVRQLRQSPDVFLVDDFLSADECASIIAAAEKEDMTQSPVVYAGWSNDVRDIVTSVSRGPALWAGACAMLIRSSTSGPGVGVLLAGAGAFAAVVGVAGAGAAAWVRYQEQQLRGMRTSTSCVLRGSSAGEIAYIKNAEALMPGSTCENFEAPTVIRYEKGQRLAPHFDANKGADVEDAKRGGQTLVTMLLYLNDVDADGGGGDTRFGKLDPPLTVKPKKGSCLVFFPATKDGVFDERLEHEGTETTQTKWICRIWAHQGAVNPPFGLPNDWKG